MHFYEWNIGDYAKKTQHLTNEEDLAYRRALDMYYDTEKPLDISNIPSLSRRLRVGIEALQNVIAEFFPGGENKHAEEKIAAYYTFIDRQKANGKLGGRPKKTQALPKPNPSQTQKNPVPSQPLPTEPLPTEPLTTNQKPLTKNHGKSKAIAPVALLAALGVDEKIAADWIILRKQKKAPVTETALTGIQREAEKAGMSLENALAMCCERGWSGFKAEWLRKNQKDSGRDLEAERREFINGDTGNVIEGDFKHA